jgi:hypothetical protein
LASSSMMFDCFAFYFEKKYVSGTDNTVYV